MEHLHAILSKLAHLDLSGQIEDIQSTAKGLGASCDVFTGYWRAGNKRVAVKKLRIFLTKEDQVVKKLAREAYIWSKLIHKNVLPLVGFFLEGGEFPHLVSEWMEKGTLHDYMPNLGRGMEIVEMVLGIASGLAYLHEKDVIHADLKSPNILISQSGEPLLADFGISHVLAASMSKMCGTTMASAKGTVRWMAIELLSLSDVSGVGTIPNEKSDVWAFGMTVYEILNRNVPYGHLKGDTVVALAISKGKLPERPSGKDKAALPIMERRLWDLCGTCWKKKPDLRPSMVDLLSKIVALQEGRSRPIKRRKLDVISSAGIPDRAEAVYYHPDTVGVPSYTSIEAGPSASSESESSSSTALVPASGSSVPGPSNNANAFLDHLNVANVPPELKKVGSDWFAVFNPKAKRQLDVNLVYTWSHESVVCCVRFSADGKFLATGCNRSAQIYETKTGAKTCVLIDEHASSQGDLYIRSVCFSPDGKYLATGADDKQIRIWDIAKKRIRRVFEGHQQEIYSLAFSHDGRLIASGSGDKTARIWDMKSGQQKVLEIMEPEGIDAGVTSVAMSSDSRLVAAGSLDTIVRIWDVATGNLVERLRGHRDSVYSVAFTPDGKGLVSGSLDKTLKHWDITPLTRPGAKREPLPPVTPVAAASPSASNGGGAVVAGGRGSTAMKEGGERGSGCTLNFAGHKDYVLSVAVSHDGRWVVSGSKDRGVQFWEQQSAQVQLMLQGHKNSVISIDLSPQGGILATGSGDWQARLWSYTLV